MGIQHCGSGSDEEHLDLENEVDRFLNELNEQENDLKKMAEITHKSLLVMSLKDACEYMMERNAPMTNENVKKFLLIAQKACEIRVNIMKNLLAKN